MAKALFLNIPAHGHMNSTLPLTWELVNRGETIVYYTGEEFRDKVESAGAEFRTYEGLGEAVRFQFGDANVRSPNMVLMARIMIQFTENVLPRLLDVLRKTRRITSCTTLLASGDCWLLRYWPSPPSPLFRSFPSTIKSVQILIRGCGVIFSGISWPESHI